MDRKVLGVVGEMKISIRAECLAVISLFQAKKDDVRYFLRGVYIEPVKGGVNVVATNGHMLGMIFAKGVEADEPLFVDITSKVRTQLKRHYGTDAVIDFDSQTITVGEDSCGIEIQSGGYAHFPDYREIIPTEFDGEPAMFEPLYMKAFIDAAAILGCDCIQYAPQARGPGIILYNDVPEFVGVLAPMRSVRGRLPLPEIAPIDCA